MAKRCAGLCMFTVPYYVDQPQLHTMSTMTPPDSHVLSPDIQASPNFGGHVS